MRLKAAIIGDLEKVMAEEYALASKAADAGGQHQLRFFAQLGRDHVITSTRFACK